MSHPILNKSLLAEVPSMPLHPPEPAEFLALTLDFLNQNRLEWGLEICLFNKLPAWFWGNQSSISLWICVMGLPYNKKLSPDFLNKVQINSQSDSSLPPSLIPYFPDQPFLLYCWVSMHLPSAPLLYLENFYSFFTNWLKCYFLWEAFLDCF